MPETKMNDHEAELFTKLTPIVDRLGFCLVDLRFKTEQGRCYLRMYVDKKGGIRLSELEAVSEVCNPLLDTWGEDRHDFFEVQSPGLDRPLSTVRECLLHVGEVLDFSLYQKLDGEKKFPAVLKEVDQDGVSLQKQDDSELTLAWDQIAQIKQIIDFGLSEQPGHARDNRKRSNRHKKSKKQKRQSK